MLGTRELALAAAIVFVLSYWFVDRQIVQVVWDSIRAIR